MVDASSVELSLIIPVLNEAAALPALFDMLGRQRETSFEVILCDGGSTDGTAALAWKLADGAVFPCRVIQSGKGRALQLNAGAREAVAELLLFLHADSDLPDPRALRKGIDALVENRDHRVAGRFGLRFDVPAERYGLGYYFYECKARLDRPECIHGDQGFFLRRSFFLELKGFDESLPMLEDTRLAEAIRNKGRWMLLPAEIVTSARRFEVEGLYERQLLNALIMNFSAIGWDDFFRKASGIYQRQDLAFRLRLLPFLKAIQELLRPLPRRRRWALWYATGRYVRPHAWQLVYAIDARRNYRRGIPAGEGGAPFLRGFDRWYESLTDHPPGRLIAAVLVWGWFHCTLLCRMVRESCEGGEVEESEGAKG